jgi:heme exporter protein D
VNHDQFVAAAYAVTLIGMLWLILSSWHAMHKSEALADDLKKDR